MPQQHRRQFLKTLAAAATVTIAGTKSTGRVLGANETIRLGVTGINGRGTSHIHEFAGMSGVQVTYLIDPDSRIHEARARQVRSRGGNTPRTVQDIRVALQDRNLDAVSVATPNHWHTLVTVWAAQAGKHVYVEKPCSHNVKEGRIAADMAQRHNVIIQHGTQSRSDPNHINTIAHVRSGRYGRLVLSRALCYKPRWSIGTRPTSDVPSGLDFNLWLGPAAQQPYHPNLVHYNWHWFWDFGNGDIGNQGVHEMDKARWAIEGATLPRSVIAVGGRYGYSDQGQTPNTQLALFDFGTAQLLFEVRGLHTGAYRGQSIGNLYHTTEGMIAGNRFYRNGSYVGEPLPQLRPPVRPGGSNHFANFIAAVRSGRLDDLNAPILEGHYSSALCHLANVSYRLGRHARFESHAEPFGQNAAAMETLARMQEHLRTAPNTVRLSDVDLTVGVRLEIDAAHETVRDNEAANRLLTRQYRAPFVVPDRVG